MKRPTSSLLQYWLHMPVTPQIFPTTPEDKEKAEIMNKLIDYLWEENKDTYQYLWRYYNATDQAGK